jgi:hypothetical protein
LGKLVKIVGAAHASLKASASGTAAKGPSVKLEIYSQNRSLVPVDLQVTALHSSDSYVASVSPTFSTILPIHLPRRPDKWFAGKPSVNQQVVGSWQPISKGTAELKAIINAAPPDVGTGAPTEDVNVV